METAKLPDPTGKTVIILTGKFAGEEGMCLGPAGKPGMFAVTPNSSNDIVQLRFDQEFGIVLNAGQEPGKN